MNGEKQQPSSAGGIIALVFGILSLPAAVVSLGVAAGAGTCGTVCCMGLGSVGAVVPALSLLLSLVTIVVAFVVLRKDLAEVTPGSRTMAKVGLALGVLCSLVNVVSLIFSLWIWIAAGVNAVVMLIDEML